MRQHREGRNFLLLGLGSSFVIVCKPIIGQLVEIQSMNPVLRIVAFEVFLLGLFDYYKRRQRVMKRRMFEDIFVLFYVIPV